jgi:hypothetical protein
MPVPACGSGRAREEASSKAETNPRARRSLLEGALDWATLVGRGDHRGVDRALGVCLSERYFVSVFLGFKQDSPGCFRGPSGLSPTSCNNKRRQ